MRSSLPALFFTNEMDTQRAYPSVFVYGIAGSGKTNLYRTLIAPARVTKKICMTYPPLVLATEDGQTKGMSTLGDLRVPAILLNKLDELLAVAAELSAHAKPGEIYYQGQGPFGGVGLDSLTGVGPMLERAAAILKGWSSGMIWDVGPGQKKDPRSAYPYIAEKGREIVRKLMSLPVPLIMMCREQIITEGEGPAAVSYPAPELPGQKLPRELPGWPEATVRIRMINGKRVLQTENEGQVVARVRLREGLRLPKYAHADLGALIRLLQGDESAIKDLTEDGKSVT